MDDKDDLERFRREWKAEVQQRKDPPDKQEPSSSSTNLKRESSSFEPFNIAEKLLEGQTGRDSLQSSEVVETDLAKEILSQKPKRLRLETEDKEKFREMTKPHTFLDIFLNDLIEITEIPFFDLQLPKELAMQIFQHFDAVDLCRCAQVSKAWKHLAEDDHLWCVIAHELGYEDDALTVDKQQWKQVVREHVIHERQLHTNWKSRFGEFHQLQYVQGGVLCSAASKHNMVVAGYTNGAIKMWDLGNPDFECTFQPSQKALVIDERAESGTLSNYPLYVQVQDKYTVAAYSQGTVDIWSNAGDSTVPVVSFSAPRGQVKHLCSGDSTVVTASGAVTGSVRVDSIDCGVQDGADGVITSTARIDMGKEISSLKLVDSKGCLPMLVVAMGDEVKVHECGGSSKQTTLHHSVGQRVQCMDASNSQVIAAVTELGSAVQKLKLYDLSSGREEGEFSGLVCGPCCINLERCPPQSFVTGSHDRKIRVYDSRLPSPVLSLLGHGAAITCVEMDDWKLVSGAWDGLVAVWDKRMAAKLWELHNRHPVMYLTASPNYLLTANIPSNKFPDMDAFDNMTHIRNRGSLHVYDFTVLQKGRKDAPEIIQSTFDEPERYNYNVRLAMPYDNV